MRKIGLTGLLATALLPGCGQDAPSQTQTEAQAAPAPVALPISASWSLDSSASRLGFASIKAGEIVETHHFSGLTGSVSMTGDASVNIPLDQIETNIELRNERMREMFFETATYPSAKISAAIDPASFKDLTIGTRTQSEIEGTLSLHGVDAPILANVYVTRIAYNRVEVASVDPVIVYVEDFNLADGLTALREVAGLPAITAAAPVTFTFVFEADVP